MSNLVHIVSIETADVSNISSLIITGHDECRLPYDSFFVKIPIIGLVGVNVEDEFENNVRIYTTKLTFRPCDKAIFGMRRKVFRLTSANGDRYLVGTNERPYPIIKEQGPFPEKPADTTINTVTVTWKSPHPMLLLH